MSKDAIIVAFDGIDGCGKTTLIDHIKKSLEQTDKLDDTPLARPVKVLTLHMLGNSEEVSSYRQMQSAGKLNPAEIGLGAFYLATHTLQSTVREARQEYDVILLDRGRSSAFAYQLWGDNLYWLEEALTALIENDRELGVEPYYFYLKSSVARSESLITRRAKGKDHYDDKSDGFKQHIKTAYDTFFASSHLVDQNKLTVFDLDNLDLRKPADIDRLDWFTYTGWRLFKEQFTQRLLSIVNEKDLNHVSA